MKWLKYFSIGAEVLNGLAEASTDNKITVAEIINIAVKVALRLGYDIKSEGIDAKEMNEIVTAAKTVMNTPTY